MPITATCPKCQKDYRVKDDVAGKKFRCKACQAIVTVPEAAADPGGHKDPWDDLDLDAYGDNPYAETDEPIEAPRARKKSPSKKKRNRSSGMPTTIKVAIGCEGVLILFYALNFVLNLARGFETPAHMIGGIAGVLVAGGINAGAAVAYAKRVGVVRWISVVITCITSLTCMGCGVLGIVGASVLVENLPPNAPVEPSEMVRDGILLVVSSIVRIVLVICLLVRPSSDWFES